MPVSALTLPVPVYRRRGKRNPSRGGLTEKRSAPGAGQSCWGQADRQLRPRLLRVTAAACGATGSAVSGALGERVRASHRFAWQLHRRLQEATADDGRSARAAHLQKHLQKHGGSGPVRARAVRQLCSLRRLSQHDPQERERFLREEPGRSSSGGSIAHLQKGLISAVGDVVTPGLSPAPCSLKL